MTLLEVLIAMFVAAVGVLGVVAMLPLAALHVRSANQMDRASAAGRIGWRQVNVQRMLDADSQTQVGRRGRSNPAGRGGRSYVIDPLLLAPTSPNAPPGQGTTFPHPGGTVNVTSQLPQMPRVNLLAWPAALGRRGGRGGRQAPPMLRSVAERTFVWQDDLALRIPEDPNQRTRAVFQLAANGTTPLYHQVRGDYTWMVTVAPVYFPDPDPNAPAGQVVADPRRATVSVVVFYKRSLEWNTQFVSDPPPERVLEYDDDIPFAGGIGGGDIRLRIDRSQTLRPSATTDEVLAEYLNIRADRWLMLAAGASPNPIFLWYRVIGTDAGAEPESADVWHRDFTLAGPDWPRAAAAQPTHAIVPEGVVGVYEKTVELDR